MKESNFPPLSENSTDVQLSSLRQEIDKIDTTIWSLLERRFDLLKEVSKIKHDLNMPILDEKREKDVLARIDALSCDPEVSSAISKIYELTFVLSRKYQK